MSTKARKRVAGHTGQRGFSLVELMIGSLLGMILLAGVVNIFLSNKETYRLQEGLSRVQENIRFSLGRMINDISAAGYMGCRGATGDILNVADHATDYSAVITGAEGGAGNPDTITVVRALARTAVPVMQPMDNQQASLSVGAGAAALPTDRPVVLSDCYHTVVFRITNAPGAIIAHDVGASLNTTTDFQYIFGSDNVSVANVYALQRTTFSIADSGRDYPSGAAIMSLFARVDEGFNLEIVEGVHDLQILYGEDTSADGAANHYLDIDAVDLDKVISVRVGVTLDSNEGVTQSVAAGSDSRLRKTYQTTIKLRDRTAS